MYEIPFEAVRCSQQPPIVNERGTASVKPLVLKTPDPRPLSPPSCDSTHDPMGAQRRAHAAVLKNQKPKRS